MNRLDSHILTVRNKLTLGLFFRALAWSALVFGAVVWLTIILQHVLDRSVRYAGPLFWSGLGVAVAVAAVYSLVRRPSRESAAVAIDQSLDLKEKFSTALCVRGSADPFAQAAVKDAENSAQNVSLYNRFPLEFPRPAYWSVAIFVAAFCTAVFLPTFHILSKPPAAQATLLPQPTTPKLDPKILRELPKIEQGTKLTTNNEAIRRAADALTKATQTKDGDELHARRSALSALQDYNKAMMEELAKNEKFQTSMNAKNQLSEMASAKDDSTPMGKAQNELKAGDLDSAMKDMGKAVGDFEKMKPEEQQKVVDQAKALAQELAKAANDPHVSQKMTQQLMQMGASQAQAQQMAAAMQQAANGNKQAQQQMQQMAQQMAQQMNNGQGPTQQQQQQIQKLMTQAQGIANSQAQAQALAASTKQLAAAMAQAKGNQQQQQNGQHPGQQQSGGNQQQMAQAQQSIQQQLGQMQAQAKDAQAMKAAADAAAQAAADAAAGLNPGDPGQGEQNQQVADNGNQNAGQNKPGQNGQGPPGGNPGANGKGGPKNTGIESAPYQTKQEVDPSKDIASGKILASRYVKAGIDPGKSVAGLQNVAMAAQKDEPDEVDQDRVSREAQQAVKEYFSAMQKEDGQ
ncbi:MAG: hypothetical protein M3O30_06895 [Planctomycetota bacterium]|nr:hypothetical protein [Planctomycetota bacterium]